MKSIVRTLVSSALAVVIFILGNTPVSAITILDFEPVGNLVPIGNFYNGGTGGNLGISFSPNSLGLVDKDAGGIGNFSGEPSTPTIFFFNDDDRVTQPKLATMNVANGFNTGLSFYYIAIVHPGAITVRDGLDGLGNILATIDLPVTTTDGRLNPPLVPFGFTFQGIAKSVAFSGVETYLGFDNLTLGSAIPSYPVPDAGSSVLLLGMAVVGLGATKKDTRLR